jgi:NTP pyrophosphatase (non-canonical NTP hydrolase)
MRVVCNYRDKCGCGGCVHNQPHERSRACEDSVCDILGWPVRCIPVGLIDRIEQYYEERELVWPQDVWQALGFATSELGEAWDVLVERDADWVRNHPSEKGWDEGAFTEECGDTIMMLMVACKLIGRDPIAALRAKMRRKTESG